jgi:hypothetical protein
VLNASPSYLVSCNFALGVVLKVTVSLESSFYQFAKLCSKQFSIVEVVYPKTRSGSLGRVCWTDSLLCCTDTASS